MSYHIVSIDAAQCRLTCRDGQLVCSTEDGERKLPLEDVASIVITSFSASIHSELVLEAARQGVALIICRDFKPVSLVLPANRSSDTLLTRAQVDLPAKEVRHYWAKTLDAKCSNQALLAQTIAPDHQSLEALKTTAAGRKIHKEAACARLFWQIFAATHGDSNFTRGRRAGSFNNLLNYGYAILLSTMLQKLFAIGLDPTFGIGHAIRERSAPLAYDLMEPFRPCVDWRVHQWMRNHPDAGSWEVTRDYRAWVTGFPLEKVEYLGLEIDIRSCIEGVVRSFRRALVAGKPSLYKPWTPKHSKWAG